MLGQRRRRWPNIESALGERLVFAGILLCKGKMEYMLTCKVSIYDIFTLHGSIVIMTLFVDQTSDIGSEMTISIRCLFEGDMGKYSTRPLNKV